jgi:hypothetical protein
MRKFTIPDDSKQNHHDAATTPLFMFASPADDSLAPSLAGRGRGPPAGQQPLTVQITCQLCHETALGKEK